MRSAAFNSRRRCWWPSTLLAGSGNDRDCVTPSLCVRARYCAIESAHGRADASRAPCTSRSRLTVPSKIDTERLTLRRRRPDDAGALGGDARRSRRDRMARAWPMWVACRCTGNHRTLRSAIRRTSCVAARTCAATAHVVCRARDDRSPRRRSQRITIRGCLPVNAIPRSAGRSGSHRGPRMSFGGIPIWIERRHAHEAVRGGACACGFPGTVVG